MGGDGNDLLVGAEPGAPDTDGRDFLNGGAGDDRIVPGQDDWASGGAGADEFTLNDWLAATEGAGPATIDDYDPAEDRLVVVYDPAAHPDPAIGVEPGDTPGEATRILLDGAVIALLQGGGVPAPEDIDLIAQGQAAPAAAA